MELAEITRRVVRVLTRPWFVALGGLVLVACVPFGGGGLEAQAVRELDQLRAALALEVEQLAQLTNDPLATPQDVNVALGQFAGNVATAIETAFAKMPPPAGDDWSVQDVIMGALLLILGGKEAAVAWAARRATRVVIGAAPEAAPRAG
jgi:hypothetical protein